MNADRLQVPILEEPDETKSPLIPDSTIPGLASRHYTALDGLRGVAVLGVLLFHGFDGLAWNNPFNRFLAAGSKIGWMGVDIFFVISGYLITGILLDSRNSVAYFRRFYARRFLRIVPVYYLLLASIFLILPRIVPFDQKLKMIEHRQAWLWMHLTNIGFIFYGKVWTSAEWLHLDHLWSLAVEEQFYLFWPFTVHFLSRKSLKLVCFTCIAVSLGLRIILWQMGQRNGAIYFPTPCRLDGLAMGALVAVLAREKGGVDAIRSSARVLGGIGFALLAGLALLRGGIIFTDKPTVVFGISFVSMLSACLVVLITGPRPGSPLAFILNTKFLRVTGKYSYGIYLFHAVLLAPLAILIPPDHIVRALDSELLGNLTFIAAFVALSYLVSFLSWHTYEKHWLKLKIMFDYSQRAPTHKPLFRI